MNKLDIALKLIRLLNERKALDSRIVATELNVSLRTAQRYLLELSSLPCVITYEKEHIYALSPDYHLKDALLHDQRSEQPLQAFQMDSPEPLKLNDAICMACDRSGRDPHGLPSFPARICNRDNRQKVNLLVDLIRKRLKEERRGYP
jgi:predicted DNA-binding transcriptional regulator YafY